MNAARLLRIALLLASLSCDEPRKRALDPINPGRESPDSGGGGTAGSAASSTDGGDPVMDGPLSSDDASVGGSTTVDAPAGSPSDSGASQLGTGELCTNAGECASGSCVDGVCCETTCPGKCQACAMQFTGLPDGSCGPARAGTDPRDECAQAPAESCGEDGFCDGTGGCRRYGKETACTPESCAAGMYTPPRFCDGQGACSPSTPVSCGAFPCEGGRCRMTCTSNPECAEGNRCQAGACVAKTPTGQACGADNECLSGACTDGVCCNDACASTCMSCRRTDTGKPDGQCEPVRAGVASGNDCPRGSESSCGNDGFCDGRGACQKHGTAVTCEAATCADGAEIGARRCDGKGRCNQAIRNPCNGLKCASGKCLTCTPSQIGGNCQRATDFCSGGNSCKPQAALGETCNRPGEEGACSSGICAENGKCCSGPCAAKYSCSPTGQCGLPGGRECDFYTECFSEQCDFRSICSAGGLCDDTQNMGDACTGPGGSSGTCGPKPAKGRCR